jgi:drug/metabolite transporter (DMT)-like permease
MSMFVKLASISGLRLPEIMFWRQFLAVPLILVWVILGPGLASLKTTRLMGHFRRGVIGTTGMCFTFGSLVLLNLAEATTLGFTVPIFATILSAVVLREHVGPHRWSAVVAGFVGALIVIQPGFGSFPLIGGLVGLIASLFIAGASIHLRDLGQTEAATTTAFYFSLLSTFVFGFLHLVPIPDALVAILAGNSTTPDIIAGISSLKAALAWDAQGHSANQWAVIAAIGLTGALGQVALSASLKYAPISTVVGMDYSALIWSTLYGALIWGVWPGMSTWLGAPVIIASGLYIAWREHQLNINRIKEIEA